MDGARGGRGCVWVHGGGGGAGSFLLAVYLVLIDGDFLLRILGLFEATHPEQE